MISLYKSHYTKKELYLLRDFIIQNKSELHKISPCSSPNYNISPCSICNHKTLCKDLQRTLNHLYDLTYND